MKVTYAIDRDDLQIRLLTSANVTRMFAVGPKGDSAEVEFSSKEEVETLIAALKEHLPE